MNEVTSKFSSQQHLFNCFLSIHDPRVGGRVTHPLINIIVITLCALICGCDTWKAIAIFAKERKHWLSQFIDLSAGLPSHHTIARVFCLIEPSQFEHCFASWVQTVCELVTDDIISIDGKTQRGSSHLQGKKRANHIISAYSPRHAVTLASIKTPDKSNEIKGVPILLKSMQISDMVITMDSMGTQKGIANLIREKQGHYVLALKENHRKFYKKVESLFNQADRYAFNAMTFKKYSMQDYGHGRIEKREFTILPLMYLPNFKKDWRDLQTFTRVQSTRYLADGKIEYSSRYFISSLPLKNHQKICHAIREHWQIENGLHYKLDVGLREDNCQIYRGNAAQNLGTMRKIVLKLLNDEASSSAGISTKRIKAALSARYLRKVVGF